MDKTQADISSRIRLIREQVHLSQEGLARELGVSFSTVNRWENGKMVPSQLARRQFETFCREMERQGRLDKGGLDQGNP